MTLEQFADDEGKVDDKTMKWFGVSDGLKSLKTLFLFLIHIF